MARTSTSVPRALEAALALAEHYFPRYDEQSRRVVAIKDAHFLLSGQIHRWDRWEELSHSDMQRIGRLLNRRADDLAGFARFQRRVRELCAPNPDTGATVCSTYVTGDADHPDVVVAVHGRNPSELADELLVSRAKPSTVGVATAGMWECRTRHRSQIIDLPLYPLGDQGRVTSAWPVARTAEALPDLGIDLAALLRTAGRIDRARRGSAYRQRQLRRVFQRMFATTSGVFPLWRLTAGRTLLLNAPTAMGKSVLIEVLSAHLAAAGYTVAVVVPDARATHRIAYDVQQALAALGSAATCTPLVSPNTRHERALRAVPPTTDTATSDLVADGEALWRLDQLSYGCALSRLGNPDRPFTGGYEPCARLYPVDAALTVPSPGGRDEEGKEGAAKAHWCPFVSTCDKFSQIRAACSASVIVTNHANFHTGRTHLPIEIDGVLRASVRIDELLLRRAHTVLVDEIDEFQSRGFDAGTSQLVLADRGLPYTPIRRLDAHLDELAPGAAIRLRPVIQQVKYLSEQLLDLLLEEVVTPRPEQLLRKLRGERTDRWTRTDWYQPGSWDRTILETVFGLDDDAEADLEILAELQALLPAAAVRDNERADDVLRSALVPVRGVLGQFISIRPEQNEPDDLREVKRTLTIELEKFGLSREGCIRATHALIMRTWLHALRAHLYSLVEEAGTLRESGVAAAQELADGVGIYGGNHPVPYGPLGHLLFGFRFSGLTDTDPDAGRLTLELIRGDAHTVAARLGDIVALTRAGHRRIVLGLSATACFVGAAREHVFTELDWCVPDTDAGTIRALRSEVVDNTGTALEIGGTPLNQRLTRVSDLGQLLAPTVAGWFARLRADHATAHRARALLATNSYAQDIHLANGLILGAAASGTSTPAVFAAVPDDPDRRTQLPAIGRGVTAIAREEFERFADHGGDILAAPMAVVARALNMLAASPTGRRESAITVVGLCVRPVMPVTEPAELAANIAAHAYRDNATSAQPAELLDQLRSAAARRLGLLLTAPRQFSALPPEIKRDLVAGLLVDLIQLVGRARRGQTHAEIHFIDGVLHNDRWNADLPSLIRLLHDSWTPDQRRLMHRVYGNTLAVLLDYAGITTV